MQLLHFVNVIVFSGIRTLTRNCFRDGNGIALWTAGRRIHGRYDKKPTNKFHWYLRLDVNVFKWYKFNYTRWTPGAPTLNKKELCVYMYWPYLYTLNHAACNSKRCFVCEKHRNYVDI